LILQNYILTSLRGQDGIYANYGFEVFFGQDIEMGKGKKKKNKEGYISKFKTFKSDSII